MFVLITAEKLKASTGRDDFVLFDVRSEAEWRAETIPGALSLNVYDYFIPESSEQGLAKMAAGARDAFIKLGIDPRKTPVFFENATGMISPRGLWFLELAGFENGLVLDGGLKAWVDAGGTLAPGQGTPTAILHSTTPLPEDAMRRGLVASTLDVLNRDPAATDLLDVRRRTEFEGSFVHPCCARPGRIPDAKFIFFEDMLSNGRYRAPEEIRQQAVAAGLSPHREIIIYCHRGARAATALYGLRLAGFENLKVYTGSWHEWAGDTALPIQIGPCEAV